MKDELYKYPLIKRYIKSEDDLVKLNDTILQGGTNNMGNIKEEAMAYESPQTKNISELARVQVDLEVTEKVFKEGTLEEFRMKTIKVEGEDYRIPVSVLESLKIMLVDNPNMKFFKVKKAGEGMKTSYTVIPLTE